MAKESRKEKKPKEEPFEDSLKRLEEIVLKLETGDLPLEDSLNLFEEGVKLTRVCSRRLDQAEKRIEVLMRNDQGEVTAVPESPDLFQQTAGNAEREG